MAQFKFKLLSGGYEEKRPVEGGKEGQVEVHKYAIGDIIDTDVNLAQKFGPEQFLLVESRSAKAAKDVPLPTANVPPIAPAPPPPVPPGQQAGTTPGNDQGPRGGTDVDLPTGADLKAEAEPGSDEDFEKGKTPGRGKAGSPIDKYGNLDHKSVKELKEIAETEEVDLGGAHTKAEIIRALKGA